MYVEGLHVAGDLGLTLTAWLSMPDSQHVLELVHKFLVDSRVIQTIA